MTMRHAIYSLLSVLCVGLWSCGPQPLTEEEQGAAMLNEARQLLQDGKATQARDTILSLRRRFPLAIEARRQAILTLDSVELQIALEQGDSLKTEFYRRKLLHDNETMNTNR